ncbi:MAG: response regulator [Pirellulales bacterium]
MSLLLIVDDEPNIRYSLELSLQSMFTEVITAETAAAAVDAVRNRRPDVVLLDVHLPDRLGLDAYRDMRRIDPVCPSSSSRPFRRRRPRLKPRSKGRSTTW